MIKPNNFLEQYHNLRQRWEQRRIPYFLTKTKRVFSSEKYNETHIIQLIKLIERLIYGRGLYTYVYAENNSFEYLT